VGRGHGSTTFGNLRLPLAECGDRRHEMEKRL
jgi:hypothetical protein